MEEQIMTTEILMEKINLIANRLVNLGGANYEADKTGDKSEFSKGNIARDFGIEEWDWPQGVGLYGLTSLQQYLGDNRYQKFFNDWFTRNMEIGLPSKNINTTAPFLSLLANLESFHNPDYEILCYNHAQWLVEELPKTLENGFQHVTSAIGDRNGVILHENELWVDTLVMAVLYLNQAGHHFKRQDWIDESIHQVLVHIKYLYDKKTGLFHHGWTFSTRDNFGGIFWGRGNSWFTFGIMDFIQSFDNDLNSGLREYFIDTYRSQVNALISLQSPSGLWHTVLDDPDSYEEVSGSSAITAGILKGIRTGVLDKSYCKYTNKAIDAICSNISEDGTVLNVSAGTGIGMNAERYKNVSIKPMAYGQALALIALTEALAAL